VLYSTKGVERDLISLLQRDRESTTCSPTGKAEILASQGWIDEVEQDALDISKQISEES